MDEEHHVYCTSNGRFSMAGVNPGKPFRNSNSDSQIPNPESRNAFNGHFTMAGVNSGTLPLYEA